MRRAARIALWIVGVLVLLRVAIWIALPISLRAGLHAYGLEESHASLSLSVLRGRATLTGVELRPGVHEGEPPAQPIVRLEYAFLDLNLGALFTGKLRVTRAELDGLSVVVDRDAHGASPWDEVLAKLASPSSAPPPKVEVDHSPLDLRSPVRVDALRVQHVTLAVSDQSVAPPVAMTLQASLRITDLGAPDAESVIQALVHSPELVDSITVEGRGHGGLRAFDAHLALAVDGLHPRPIAGWLSKIDLDARAERIGASGALDVALAPDSGREGVRGTARISGVDVRADGSPALELGAATVPIDELTRSRASFGAIRFEGLSGFAARAEDGNPMWCGIAYAPPANPASPPAIAPSASAVAASASTGAPATSAARLTVSIAEISAAGARFTLHDRAVAPANAIEIVARELALRQVALGDAEEVRPSTLVAEIEAPGIVERASLDGTLTLSSDAPRAELECRARGIQLARLEPELRAVNCSSDLRQGTFEAEVRCAGARTSGGEMRFIASVNGVSLEDGAPLFALQRLLIEGLVLGADGVRLGRADVAGIDLALRRDGEGGVHALGICMRPPPASEARKTSDARQQAAPSLASSASTGAPARFELHHGSVAGVRVRIEDDAAEPPQVFELAPCALTAENIVIGRDRADGVLDARLSVAGIMTAAEMHGALSRDPQDGASQLALRVHADGIDLARAEPYFDALGMNALMQRGAVDADARVVLRAGGLDAELRRLEVQEAGKPLARFAGLRADGMRIEGDAPTFRRVELSDVDFSIAREERGAWSACGVKLLSLADAVIAARRQPRLCKLLVSAPREQEPVHPLIQLLRSLPTPIIDAIVLKNARVALEDRTLTPPRRVEVTAKSSAQAVDLTRSGKPASFDCEIRASECIDSARVTGTVSLGRDSLKAHARFDASGLHPGALFEYLPSELRFDSRDARAGGEADLSLSANERGGVTVSLALDKLVFQESGAELPAFAAEHAAVNIDRWDESAGVYAIGEVSMHGGQIACERLDGGRWRACGCVFDPKLAAERRENAAHAVEASAPGPSVMEPQRKPIALNELSLAKLDVEVASARFIDRTLGADARAMVGRVHATTRAPWAMTSAGADAEKDAHPLELAVSGALEPLAGAIEADVHVAREGGEVHAAAELKARDIHGAELSRVCDVLPASLDMYDLDGAQASGRLSATLRLPHDKRSMIDLARPFSAEVALDDVVLRTKDGGEVLAGLQRARADISRVDPASGDVHVRELELSMPSARIRRDQRGVHALGLTLAFPAPSAAAGGDAPAAKPRDDSSVAAPGRGAPRERSSELAIDRLSVQGIDVVLTDETAPVPVIIPLHTLDLEVRRFSTRAFEEKRAIAFEAYLGGDKVALPKRSRASSLATRMIGGGEKLVAGETDEKVDLVPTLLFDEVALQGRVSFVPALEGRASMEVVGFELLGVRGLAEEQGFEIGDGTLDARVKMRFQGQDGIAVDAKSTFTHLSLSEPSGGPISRYLSLPMPLDTVLFLTKNEADEHVVPVSVHLEEGQIGHGELLSAIMQATGVVLAEAVASAPLRLVTGVTSLFGVDLTGSAASDGDPTLSLEYAVGAVELSPAEHAKLAEFVRGLGANSSRVLAIEHAFGRGDLARADVLGNPPHEETRDLVDGLRTRKGSLVRQRDESSAAARVSAALGDRSELAAAQERMSALDRELAGVEDALDAALELERNGAERHRDGRARRAALEIGRARVSALREALLELGVGGARQEPRPVRLSGDLVLEKGTVRIVAHPRK